MAYPDYFASDSFYEHRDNICKILEKIPTVREPKGWRDKGGFAAGGFEYFGFHEDSDLMLVISSQKTTIMDLSKMEIISSDDTRSFPVDETFMVCEGFDMLENKTIRLAGKEGSMLPACNVEGERLVRVSPLYPCEDLIFCPPFEDCLAEGFNKNCVRVYRGFLYCYGFSFSGNYFVVADEGGIRVWEKR